MTFFNVSFSFLSSADRLHCIQRSVGGRTRKTGRERERETETERERKREREEEREERGREAGEFRNT